MHGLIRRELLHAATYNLPRAVQLRNSHDTISSMGVFSESGLAVLTHTLNKELAIMMTQMSSWWCPRLTMQGRPLPN
jgi:hypothetical protein